MQTNGRVTDRGEADRQTAWWRHQMESFSELLAICAGNSPVTGDFPAQRPVTRSFDVFFDLRLIKRFVNNRKTGDLRRYRAHCDVIAMRRDVFLAANKQLCEWSSPSVCLSVRLSRLSVTPFWLCSHHRIIMKFSGVITNDRSGVHAKAQGPR